MDAFIQAIWTYKTTPFFYNEDKNQSVHILQPLYILQFAICHIRHTPKNIWTPLGRFGHSRQPSCPFMALRFKTNGVSQESPPSFHSAVEKYVQNLIAFQENPISHKKTHIWA